jgi:hypothetical protein
MAGVTKVGPPDPGDKPKRRGWFDRFLRRATLGAGLFSPGAYRVAEAEQRLEQSQRKSSEHGLPEAELPDAQREAAAEHLKRENAMRRARGER